MNPTGFFGGIAQFSAMSAWAVLLCKATLLLAFAWLVHFALARANPRWRIFLWRGIAVGLVLPALWIFGLPGVKIYIQAPQPAATTVSIAVQPDARHDSIITANNFKRPIKTPIDIGSSAASRQTPVEVQSETARPAKSPIASMSWQSIILGIWGMGMAALIIRLAIGYVRLSNLLKDSRPAPDAVLAEARRIAAALGCRRMVRICVSERFAVPFICGLLRPTVVLPARMCESAFGRQLSAILAHELAHVRSWDVLWNMLVQAVSIVLWFHPLTWRIVSVHRAACDVVCDAVSASYLGDVQDYCRTLARVALDAAQPVASAGLAMARTSDVRRRLAMLQSRVFALPLRRRAVVGAAIIGISILTLVAGLKFALAETPPKASEQQVTTSAEKKDQGVEKPSDDKAKEDQKTAAEDSTKPGFRPMTIQVSDAEGKPLAGADITAYGQAEKYVGPFKCKTDAEGKATIDAPRKDEEYYGISVEKSGYITATAEWNNRMIDARIPDTFAFTLESGAVLGGRVCDEQGNPIAGVKISVWGQKSPPNQVRRQLINQTVTTDSQGKWRIDCAATDLSAFALIVVLEHPEFGRKRFAEKELPLGELLNQRATLILRKGVALEGTVSYPDGKPAAGAIVGLYVFNFGSDGSWTKTDENGHYRIVANEPGEYTIAATADGFVPDWKKFTVGKDRQTVDLKVGKGEMIRLRVIDQGGKPIPGARIGFILEAGQGNMPPIMLGYQHTAQDDRAYRTRTDTEGRWSMLWVPGDRMRLYVEKKGYIRLQKSFSPDLREQVVTLEAGEWSVSGRVVDQETKAPIKEFRVTEGWSNSNNLRWAESRPVTNENGEYHVTWDRTDEYRAICIEADGYYPSKTRFLGNVDKQAIFNVELQQGENISGVIRSPEGKLLANVDVAFCTPGRDCYVRNGRIMSVGHALTTRTGSDGHFSLPPQNDHFILVATHELGFAQIYELKELKEITLQSWATVEGTVPIDGKQTSMIVLTNITPLPVSEERIASWICFDFEPQIDEKGHFVLQRVKPGRAELVRLVNTAQPGSNENWTPAQKTQIEVGPGQTLKIDFPAKSERWPAPPAKAPMGAMQPLPLEPDDVMRPLKGTVVDLQGKSVSGAEVRWAYGVSPPDFGATSTDASGKFTIPGLDVGGRPEIVAVDRRRKLKGHLIISTTPQDDVKIMLLPTGTITGRVTDGKAPLPKVNVDLSARVETIPGNTANYDGIASTVTDADGRYKFEMVEAARDHIVSASAEGYTSDTSSKPLMVGADETVKIRDFEIQRGNMAVTGIVVDPDGNPLEGVRVRAIERSSRPVYLTPPPPTGKDGRFTIANLPNTELILSVDDYHPRANNIPIMFPTLAEVGPGQTEARIVVDPKILHKGL
jgi:beta-lactamase regulating signal transducer with metallopeptidase domain/protocatechuate 3,4-dioxygenase beta subunit